MSNERKENQGIDKDDKGKVANGSLDGEGGRQHREPLDKNESDQEGVYGLNPEQFYGVEGESDFLEEGESNKESAQEKTSLNEKIKNSGVMKRARQVKLSSLFFANHDRNKKISKVDYDPEEIKEMLKVLDTDLDDVSEERDGSKQNAAVQDSVEQGSAIQKAIAQKKDDIADTVALGADKRTDVEFELGDEMSDVELQHQLLIKISAESERCDRLLKESDKTKHELQQIAKVTKALQRQNIFLNRQLTREVGELKSEKQAFIQLKNEQSIQQNDAQHRLQHYIDEGVGKLDAQSKSLLEAISNHSLQYDFVNERLDHLYGVHNKHSQIMGGLNEKLEELSSQYHELDEYVATLHEEAAASAAAEHTKSGTDSQVEQHRVEEIERSIEQQQHCFQELQSTLSELQQVMVNREEMKETIERQLTAANVLKEEAESSASQLKERSHQLLLQCEQLNNDFLRQVDWVHQKASDMEGVKSDIDKVAMEVIQYADQSKEHAHRSEQCRKEIELTFIDCQQLLEESHAFQDTIKAVSPKLTWLEQVDVNIHQVNSDLESVLAELAQQGRRTKALEQSAKDQMAHYQSCLAALDELKQPPPLLTPLESSGDEAQQSAQENQDQHQGQHQEQNQEQQLQRLADIEANQIKHQEADQQFVEFKARFDKELLNIESLSQQFAQLQQEVSSLLVDVRSEIETGIVTEASDRQSLLDSVASMDQKIAQQQEHQAQWQQQIEAQVQLRIDEITEEAQRKQAESDLLLEKHCQANAELIKTFEALKSDKVKSDAELTSAIELMEELRELSVANEKARDSLSESMDQVQHWIVEGKEDQKQSKVYYQKIDNALQALADKQKLLNIVMQDSERMYSLINQTTQECQQLSERVDMMIEEGRKQQDQFRDESEELLHRAEAHEKRVIKISERSDEVAEIIKSAQIQAQSASMESTEALLKMSQIREETETHLVTCKKILMNQLKSHRAAKQLLEESKETFLSEGEAFTELRDRVNEDLKSFHQHAQTVLTDCESQLNDVNVLTTAVMEEKKANEQLLSESQRLLNEVEQHRSGVGQSEARMAALYDQSVTFAQEVSGSKAQFEQMRNQINARFVEVAQAQDAMMALQESLKNEIEQEIKVELTTLLEANQSLTAQHETQQIQVDELLAKQSDQQRQADAIYQQCQTLNSATEEIHQSQSERFADLIALSQQLREQHDHNVSLIESQQLKNRELTLLFDTSVRQTEHLEKSDASVQKGVEELRVLVEANRKAQKVINDNIRFVRALQSRIDQSCQQAEQHEVDLKAIEQTLLQRQQVLDEVMGESAKLSQQIKTSFEDYAAQLELLLAKGSAQQEAVQEGLNTVTETTAEAQEACREVKRLAQQSWQRLTVMEKLQDEADQAFSAYESLAEENQAQQKTMQSTIRDLLRYRAKSATLQLNMKKEAKHNRTIQASIESTHDECQLLLKASKNQLTQGDLHYKKMATLEKKVEELFAAVNQAYEQTQAVQQESEALNQEQKDRLSNIIILSERLQQQQQQSDRLISNQSERNQALESLIEEQSEMLSEHREQAKVTEGLQTKIESINDAGRRTQRIVVEHIHQMRALSTELQNKGESIESRQDKIEALERALQAKNEHIESILAQSESLKAEVEESVMHCKRVSGGVEERYALIQKDQDALHDMAQTTREFERSCYEIKSAIEKEAESVRELKEDAAQWVSETQSNVVEALENNQKAIAAAGEDREKNLAALAEQEVKHQALSESNERFQQQLSTAEGLFKRWESRWEASKHWQSDQQKLLQQADQQLKDSVQHALQLKSMLDEKERQSTELQAELSRVTKQASEQHKVLERSNQLIQESQGREGELQARLAETVALNKELAVRLNQLEPQAVQFDQAVQAAKRCAEEAVVANKDVQVTQREMEVAFSEIRNELKSIQIKVDQSAAQPVNAAVGRAHQMEERAGTNAAALAPGDRAEKVGPDKQDLEAIGLVEPYVMNPSQSSDEVRGRDDGKIEPQITTQVSMIPAAQGDAKATTGSQPHPIGKVHEGVGPEEAKIATLPKDRQKKTFKSFLY